MSHQRKGLPNALNKGSTISTKEKKRAEEPKAKGPAVSHLKHYCLSRGENVNVFFGSTSKIFFYFVLFDQFNVLLVLMLLYFHKIGENINKDHFFQQSSNQ